MPKTILTATWFHALLCGGLVALAALSAAAF